MSGTFYNNIINKLKEKNSKYDDWISYNSYEDLYECNIVRSDFDEWIKNGMKG